jgi:HPt (histidine-containing phosphotransfer) domain-containing protein
MTDSLPVIDLPEALNRALGDTEFLKMMMDELFNSIPDFMGRLENSVQTGDMQSLDRDAHQFKGASANLGAKAVAAAAYELEKIGKSADAGASRQALEKLKTEIDRFNQAYAQIDWANLG